MLIKKLFLLFFLLLFDILPFLLFGNCVKRLHRIFKAPNEFQFTAPQYNLSIYENAPIGTVAVVDQSLAFYQKKPLQFMNNIFSDGVEKVGVFLPKGYQQISFKIVEGDKQQRFIATAKKLGNFAFLSIEYRHDDILNREMQSDYCLLIRAIAKKKKSNALEASAIINLRILDENDNSPMFRQIKYSVKTDDNIPLNSRLIQLDGFDADEGLNGELWFSQISISDQFFVEPETGWIRNYAPLRPGNYLLDFRIEDRASRLFYYEQEQSGASPFGFIRNRATLEINVTSKRTNRSSSPKIYFKPFPFEPFQFNEQLAGVFKVEDEILDSNFLDLRVLLLSNFTHITQRVERISNSEFNLFITNSIDSFIIITVEIYEFLLLNRYALNTNKIFEKNFTLIPDFSKRMVWFDFTANFAKKNEVNADRTEIKIFINESTTIGFVIEQFIAQTTYLQDLSRIRYKLESIQESLKKPTKTVKTNKNEFVVAPFDLNYRKGQLRLKSNLDYDSEIHQKEFTYKLIALIESDFYLNENVRKKFFAKTEIRLIIKLVDINDNCPEFLPKSLPKNFQLEISDKNVDAIIFRPIVRDLDSGKNSEIVFKLIGVSGSEKHFEIDSKLGEVKILNNLLANVNEWTISILAMDLGYPISHYSKLTLNIFRKNSTILSLINKKNIKKRLVLPQLGVINTCELPNNFSPSFQRDNKNLFFVDENAPIKTIIGTVLAIDKDLSYNGIVQHLLQDLYFGIDIYNGNLFVRNNLTRLIQENKQSISKNGVDYFDYNIEVIAQDSALNHLKIEKIAEKFIIRIRGSNSHNPIFEKSSYNLFINENTPIETELIQLRANDADIGQNGRVEYRIAIETNNLVSIDPDTGVLRLEKLLYREIVLSKTNFGIQSFELIDKIDFLIMALDRGTPPRIGFTNFTINLVDINNNPPYCFDVLHNANLFEDAPNNQLVTCLGASDIDNGTNAELFFELNNINFGNSKKIPFRVDNSSGCIFVDTDTPFDFEKVSSYNFSIKVSDKGTPKSLSTNCAVQISLIDVNENIYPPQFTSVALEASIEENLPPKSEIIRLQAIDPEGTLVTYKLVSGTGLGLFEIDSISGVIRTIAKLDFEENSFYWLTVSAEDSAPFNTKKNFFNLYEQLISYCHIFVRVLNKNDRAPVFTQPIYFTSIMENSPENKVVIKIEAIDPDYNKLNERSNSPTTNTGGVKYSIVKGNPQSNFAIDENTGYIVTGKRRLDCETLVEHELHVRACDFGSPQLCTTAIVVVNVEDVNDCAPTFSSKKITVNVPADQPPGSFLYRIFATDADVSSSNSALRYRIYSTGQGGLKENRFTIDNFGRIYAQETLKAGIQIQLKIIAQDDGIPALEANTTVTLITLGRANKFTVSNRRPRLIDSHNWRELYISDSDVVGVIVGIVKAIDEDNDPLWWSISDSNSSNPNNTFSFRYNKGELVLARPLNTIDSVLNEIKLIFTVSDGIDFVQDEIKIRISRSTILRPKFVEPFAIVKLNTDITVGYVMYTVQAYFDKNRAEISHLHRISYSIHSIDDVAARDMFRIDQSFGNLIVEKPLGLKKLSQNFSIILSAKVFGKENFARIEVQITAINEHAPKFIFDQYEFVLPTRQEIIETNKEMYIGFVEAFDPDPREYGRISYAIISGNDLNYFKINTSTGELYLTLKFDVQKIVSQTILTIRAVDMALVPKSTTCAVYLYETVLFYEMENQQQMLQLVNYYFNIIIEDTALIHSDLALLKPKNSKGLLQYSLNNEGNDFKLCNKIVNIDFVTGHLTIASHLYKIYEPLIANCSILVQTSFAYGKESIIAYLLLKIIPRDWRNNLYFKQNEYFGTITENSLNGTPLQLISNDLNLQNSSLRISIERHNFNTISEQNLLKKESIRFKILSTKEPYFSIENLLHFDNTKAIIKNTLAALDFEMIKEWHFFIIAQIIYDTENDDISLLYKFNYAQPCFIKIFLNDINDVAPYFVSSNSENGDELPYKFSFILPPVYGMQIGRVIAKDDDTIGELRYAIRQIEESYNENGKELKTISTAFNRLFAVHRYSGVISIATNNFTLFKAPFYLLKIIVSDGIHTNYSYFQIRAINASSFDSLKTNSIQLQSLYTITVTENQTISESIINKPLLSIWPKNLEFGETIKFYLLNQHNSFILDEQCGLLWFNYSAQLDRELNDKIQLGVQVISDRANDFHINNKAFSIINVNVDDINDCAPIFLQNIYSATISEEANVGFRVTTVKAKDNDLGLSGVVRYKLDKNAPKFFEINKYDGRITIKKKPDDSALYLGAEMRFYVIASDMGTPSLNSSVEVWVQVANKNQLTFAYLNYLTHVSEAAAIGTHVVTVRAHSNTDGIVGYQIKDGDPYRRFSIDFNKGTIIVNNTLDRELFSSYNLSIEAVDITRASISAARTTVTIFVDGTDDSPPQFDQIVYEIFVSENTLVSTMVGVVHAYDQDFDSLFVSKNKTYNNNNNNIDDDLVEFFTLNNAKNYLSYSIYSTNNSVISIDSITGQLFLASELDYETDPFYEYTIIVQDLNRLSSEALLKVFVIDANDCAPEWQGATPLRLSIFDNFTDEKIQFIYNFYSEVFDNDTVSSLFNKQSKNRFIFEIVAGDLTIFSLNPNTGVLTTFCSSDSYKKIAFNPNIFSKNANINLQLLNISISDGLFKTFVPVEIELISTHNLLSPLHFQHPFYSVSISEFRLATNKSSILTVKAKGGDNFLRYSIAGQNNTNFWPVNIEAESGRIFLSKRLNRENFLLRERISVPLSVRDSFGRLAFTRLEIIVNDENDNAPIWVAPTNGYSLCFDTNTHEGDPIAMVMATDADIDDQLEFSLLSGLDSNGINPQKIFDIHSTQGFITLKKNSNESGIENLIRNRKQISFLVRVSDSGNPPHQSEIAFNVRFIENALFIPQFSQLHYLFAISEDASIEKMIGTLQANQFAQNSKSVRYSIVSYNLNDLPFSLNKINGELTLTQKLDFETQESFHFVAEITDTNGNDENNDLLYSFAIITISVVDVNDNAPVFKTIYESFEVMENTVPGTIVAMFFATDADRQSDNSRIIYSIENLNSSPINNDFVIDSEYGWLSIGSTGIDYERSNFYKLKIIASDESGLNTSQIVNIKIIDENDSPPIFDQVEYSAQYELSDSFYSFQNDFFSIKNFEKEILHFKITDLDSINKSLHIFISDCSELLNAENSQTTPNFILSELFNVSTDNSQLLLTNYPPKLLFVKKNYSLITGCLIASDKLHYSYAKFNVEFKMQINSKTKKNLCDYFEKETITVPANLDKGHIIYKFKKQFIHKNLSFINGTKLNFHLINFGLPFEIRNNSEIVILSNEFYQKPAYIMRIRINLEEQRVNYKKIKPMIRFGSCVQTINVVIQNANRMTPIFIHKIFSTTVKENLIISTDQEYFVIKIDARDDDFGEFGKLSYFIEQNQTELSKLNKIKEHFQLNKETGVLTLRKALDREINNFFEIPVRAQDGGGFFTTAKILVHIEDVNDNPPVFEKSTYYLKVLENEAIGYELLNIHANDSDLVSNIHYQIVAENNTQLSYITSIIQIDKKTGSLKLSGELDYEKIKRLSFIVEANDNGNPPLSSKCFVEIDVLDVNDNVPKFVKTLYEVDVLENSEINTTILQVLATDADSEHFGRVSYTLSSTDEVNSADYFFIDNNGTIKINKQLDYEKFKLLKFNVHAFDGGLPPLSNDAIVQINIIDVNDNAPQFSTCNMTAVVQEGVQLGQALLSISLTDADSSYNSVPYKLEITGEGATSFAFDPLQNLIATQKILYAKTKQFSLFVKASDVGGLSTICPLQIFVKPQSKFPPQVKPLLIRLNTLMGEFLGGKIGKVVAFDQDHSDMLRYSIVDLAHKSYFETSNRASPRFTIDSETGVVTAKPDLLHGLYHFNVSVTDGKFIVYGPVTIEVSDIDQESLDHSVSIKLRRISAQNFVKNKIRAFYKTLAREIGVSTISIRILSIQNQNSDSIERNRRKKRNSLNLDNISSLTHNETTLNEDLDILFTVSRGELSTHGYYRPTYIKQKIENSINSISTKTDLDIVSISSEVCRRDLCVKGDCRDRLWLDNVELQIIDTNNTDAFVSPRHQRTFECICRQGYSGRFCDVPVNQCSKELCMRTEICIPTEEESSGFTCTCPPGFHGERCAEPKCDEPSVCSQQEALSLLGNGFIQLAISTSMESRLELGLSFKSVSYNAVLMSGRGLRDFHEIRILKGLIEYRWDCGSGEGLTRLSTIRVNDGAWHELKISRRGRKTTMILDGIHFVEGTSPPGSDVINLFQQATILTFGARVKNLYELNKEIVQNNDSIIVNNSSLKYSTKSHRHRRHSHTHFRNSFINEPGDSSIHSLNRRHYHFRNYFQPNSLSSYHFRETAQELQIKIEDGMTGCFGKISIDGYDLSKTEQGLRMQNAAIGCDTSSMGPCLSVPCKNDGQCLPNRTHNSYSCNCPTRFTGSNCEIDLNACASSPCPNGVPCHNLYNDFHCSCPSGFTGKTCQLRGDWDPCVTKPCGTYGVCVRHGTTFTCNCSNGFSGDLCADRVPKIKPDSSILINSFEFYLLLAVFGIAIIFSIFAVFICQRKNSDNNSTIFSCKKTNNDKQSNSTKNSVNKSLAKTAADEACNPLVPKHTAAPFQSSSNQSPPPLPPKLSRQAQLYQNLGSGNTHTSNINGLPTVEVRPIQSVVASSRILNENCSNSPLLIKQRQNNHKTKNNLSGSNNNSIKSNSSRNHPQPPPHQRQYQTGNSINHHNNLRDSCASGLCCPSGSTRQTNHRNSPMLEFNLVENKQKNHLSQDGEKNKITGIVQNTSKEQGFNKINKLKNEHISQKRSNNNDYLTMKPIHRAKPFIAQAINENSHINDKFHSASQKPPTPPAHRPLIQKNNTNNATNNNKCICNLINPCTGECVSKLYDNPNDSNDQNNIIKAETLSNTTSSALDE